MPIIRATSDVVCWSFKYTKPIALLVVNKKERHYVNYANKRVYPKEMVRDFDTTRILRSYNAEVIPSKQEAA